jgi:hypothetical protein
MFYPGYKTGVTTLPLAAIERAWHSYCDHLHHERGLLRRVASRLGLFYKTVNFFNYNHGVFPGVIEEDTPELVSLGIFNDVFNRTDIEKAALRDRHA